MYVISTTSHCECAWMFDITRVFLCFAKRTTDLIVSSSRKLPPPTLQYAAKAAQIPTVHQATKTTYIHTKFTSTLL